MTVKPQITALTQCGFPLRAAIRSEFMRGAGGGGAGGSTHTPVEQPDSLRSIAFARILDFVSEGEIEGFALGSDHALECIYLDQTPIGNADGSLNFQNVQVDSRAGTQDQTFMTGWPAVENEVLIGVELKSTTPFTRAITDLSLTALNVRMSVPNGLQKSDSSTGDINGYYIAYKIEIQADSGAFVTMVNGAFAGKASSTYERSHRLDLPPATTGWTLRITRITANANSATVADITDIVSMTEIVDGKFRYPNSALVGIVVDASQFQNIPTRGYHLKGRIVSVPSNYNPTTRAYTGSWDGTFKPAYTNNPAWVYYDIATNPRFALGDRITPAQVNKWALYAIAQYCDGLVPDGKGGTEPRMTTNVYLQTRADAYKVLSDLATVFRGVSFYANGMIQASADMPSLPVYTYTDANVVTSDDGIAFSYQGAARSTRYTSALVSWNDPSNFYTPAVEPVQDDDGIARFGIQQTEVTAIGCTSQGQAQRFGRWTILTSQIESEIGTINVGLDGTLAIPGQIVRFADTNRMGRRVAGRISAATATSITVDKIPVASVTDTLTITLPSGVTESHAITAISGKTISIASPGFSAVPVPTSIWLVESTVLTAPTYRVLGRKDNGDMTYTITALRSIAGKFDAIDNDTKVVIPPTSLLQPKVQPAPVSVLITSTQTAGAVNSSTVMTVSWPAATYAVNYLVEYQCNHGEWVPLPKRTGLSVDVQHIQPGDYLARVTAFSATGNASQPTISGTLTVVDQTLVPESVAAAKSAAAAAQADADAANAALADIASDNLLSPVEKSTVIRDYNVIVAEQFGIDSQAVAFGITTEKTAYDNAINALFAYLTGLTSPVPWNNVTGKTVIVGPTFRTSFANVYTTRQTLLDAIYAAAKAKADAAQSTADQAKSGAAVLNPQFVNGTQDWTFDFATGFYQEKAANSPDSACSTYLVRQGHASTGTTTARNGGYLAVIPGQTVTAACCIRDLSGNAGSRAVLRINWLDATHAEIIGAQTYASASAGPPPYFTQCVSRAIGQAPANAAFARVEISYFTHTSGYYTATSFNMAVQPSNQDEVPDGSTYNRGTSNPGAAVVLRNADFELGYDAQGNIPGWQSHAGGEISLDGGVVGSGTWSLKCTNHLDGSASGAQLDKIQCSAGDSFAVRAIARAAVGAAATVSISYYDNSGGFLTSFTTSTTAFGVWQQLSLGSADNCFAPTNTAYMQLLAYQTSNTGYCYFDSFLVTRTINAGQHIKGTFSDTSYLPAVAFAGYGAGWSGMTATYSVPTTGTTVSFTASAATLRSGSKTYSYSASSATVTQARGTTVSYYLYYDSGTGGSPALGVTTSSFTALAGDSRVIVAGPMSVVVPASGSGGSGGGGVGCPLRSSYVVRRTLDGEETIQAEFVHVGDRLRVIDPLTGALRWGRVSMSKPAYVDCVKVQQEGGIALSCSVTAPLGLASGEQALAPDSMGKTITGLDAGEVVRKPVVHVRPIGRCWVQHITCEDTFFLAGDDVGRYLSHHNLKPLQ